VRAPGPRPARETATNSLRLDQRAARPSLVDYGLIFAGVAGLAASITAIFLSMRAVLDIGGACADGGPYVAAQPCPEGVALLLPLGIFGWFGFAALTAAGTRTFAGWPSSLAFLAWPALFISLGWNFLEFGFAPPEGGIEMGFVVPGVVFMLMGGAPLVFLAAGWWDGRRRLPGVRDAGGSDAGPAPAPETRSHAAAERDRAAERARATERSRAAAEPTLAEARAGIAGAMGAVVAAETTAPVATAPGVASGGAPPATQDDEPSLVEELERLAAMRRRGDLSMMEYDAAKRAVIRDREAHP
jgi:hypothetical protein